MGLELAGLRWIRQQGTQGLIGALYVAAVGAAVHAGPGALAQSALGAGSLVALLAWSASLRRARTIANIATSRIASAAQGYVELMGRTGFRDLIHSPLSNTPCVWYRYRVFERSGRGEEWREVEHVTSSATFDLVDDSGQCTIDPDHAEVMGVDAVTRYVDDTKQVEELLHGGRTLYALGEFTTIGGAHSELNVRQDVGALLTQWKADTAALHRRFDLNRDGQIDLQEWELARRLAARTVAHEHRAIRAQPGVHLLRAPSDGRLFLLSPLSPTRLRRRYLLWSLFHLTMCLGLAYGAFRAGTPH